MTDLPHRLDRELTILASRDIVFRFLTDTARWEQWWGRGSSMDARPGGRVVIRYPNGVVALGDVVEVKAPERLVFTYGYESGKPIAPGASRVSIDLEPAGTATRLRLTHDFADPTVRDAHVFGWRYQLAVFSNAVSDEINAGAAPVVDGWFSAWSEADADLRRDGLFSVAANEVRFRDRFGATDGIEELLSHISAAQQFMPGMRLERRGAVRHCQGIVLADWVARGGDGNVMSEGTNVYTMNSDGRIESVTGVTAKQQ